MAMKILMTTMSLGIGGAETHMSNSASELKRRGLEVMIASNGGVFVAEIEEKGIRHFQVPMNKRNVIHMLRSYFLLKRIIRPKSRILSTPTPEFPPLSAACWKKTLRFPFITTAHWVFDISGSLRYLSDWV
jgi:hypothetical protein